MSPENKAVFQECRQYYLIMLTEGRPRGISYQQRMNLEKAIAEEFQSGFTANRDCEACINSMMSLAYYYYDTYEAGKH